MEPGQSVNIAGNNVGGNMNTTINQYVTPHYGGVTGHVDLGSHPLICFPTRLDDKDCVGRKEEVAALLKLVKKNHHVLVKGCGGIGKTTISIKCAENWTKAGWFRPRQFQYAAFLLMENKETAKKSFTDLAKECKLQLDDNFLPQLPSIYDKLNKYKILLVCDNIDDEMSIKCYLPSKTYHTNIFVLGTSQHHMPHLFHVHNLSELSERAAVAMVKSILKPPTDIPEDLLRELAQSLDCLALAVRQAASSIHQDVQETGKDIVKAIETYMEESVTRFNDEFPQEFRNYYGKTVYASLHHNISKCVKEDKLAERLLHVLSYLHPTGISKYMLRYLVGLAEDDVNKLTQRFIKYSIVAEEDDKWRGACLAMHRTTQAIIRCAFAHEKTNVLLYMFHMILTCDRWDGYSNAHIHLRYVLPEMSESMLTQGYRSLFTSDTYKLKREKLKEYEEELVLEWEAPQFAAYLGHWRVLDRMTQLSSPDTWVTERGWSWIHAAALSGWTYALNEYMADSLTKHKQVGKTGHTAVHLAAIAGSEGCITELIRMGVDLNTKDARGDSALYIALSRGHLYIALELLEAGSEINPDLCSEITATYTDIRALEFLSSFTGREHPVEIDIQHLYNIIDGEEKLIRPETLIRLFKFAETSRNTQVFQEIQNESGNEFRAVLEAVDGIWVAAVVALGYMRQNQLTIGQLVEEISGEGQIPNVKVLYPPQARCSKALAFTKLLLNKIKNTSFDAFSILVVLTALPDLLTVSKVFHYLGISAEKGLAAIVVLQGYGIWHGTFDMQYTYIRDLYGTDEMRSLARVYITLEELPSDTRTSLFTTILCGFNRFEKNLARLVLDQMSLQELTSAYERVSRLDSDRGWPEMLKRLQKAGCRIESTTDVKWSPLHYAVVFDDFLKHAMEKLLKFGVEVDVRGPGGITPLHMAPLRLYTKETVPLLLNKGAQVNAMTHEGLTPLHIAASSTSKDGIRDLLEGGADPQIKDKNGHTPDLADLWRRDAIINILKHLNKY